MNLVASATVAAATEINITGLNLDVANKTYMIFYSLSYAMDASAQLIRMYINNDRTATHYNVILRGMQYQNGFPVAIDQYSNDPIIDDNGGAANTSSYIMMFMRAPPDGYLRVTLLLNGFFATGAVGLQTINTSYMKSDATLSSVTRIDFVSEFANALTGTVKVYEI